MTSLLRNGSPGSDKDSDVEQTTFNRVRLKFKHERQVPGLAIIERTELGETFKSIKIGVAWKPLLTRREQHLSNIKHFYYRIVLS